VGAAQRVMESLVQTDHELGKALAEALPDTIEDL
jgi:hypothetical protein